MQKPSREAIWLTSLRLIVCACAGFIFGWALEKSRVFEPRSIRYQMVFQRWIMLKVFLTAVATGQVFFMILSLLPWTKSKFNQTLVEYYSNFEKKSFVTTLIGAFILGAGMTICGACPGMVLSQVGARASNAWITLLGCLTAALLYGMIAPWIVNFTKPKQSIKYHLVHEQFNVKYFMLALPVALLLVVAVFIMEYFIDWKTDLDIINNATARYKEDNIDNILKYKAWPPYVCGMIIGSLQLVLVLAINDTMGGSSSYVTVMSQWVVTKSLQKNFPYLANARCGIGNWWQVIYVCSAILGALLSSKMSNTFGTTIGVDKIPAFFGGFLMLIGARFASGCTSGHGLSGFGILAWFSIVAVPTMFAGAISVGFIFKACNILEL